MSKPTVIAFLGRAGAGKTTAANYLVERYAATKLSFAGPLKELAKRLLDFNEAQLYGDRKEVRISNYGFTPRQFLQRLGNEARDIIGPNVWIDALKKKVFDGPSGLYVIDDCRYVNEVEAVMTDTRMVGRVLKIECHNRQSQADPNHPSEAQVDLVAPDDIDMVVQNNMDRGVLWFRSIVDKAYQELL